MKEFIIEFFAISKTTGNLEYFMRWFSPINENLGVIKQRLSMKNMLKERSEIWKDAYPDCNIHWSIGLNQN